MSDKGNKWKNIKNFSNINNDLRLVLIASECLKLINGLVKENYRDPKIFGLLKETLIFLNSNPKVEKLNLIKC